MPVEMPETAMNRMLRIPVDATVENDPDTRHTAAEKTSMTAACTEVTTTESVCRTKHFTSSVDAEANTADKNAAIRAVISVTLSG